MIYLLFEIVSPGGSSTVHIYTKTTHGTTQITTNLEECGPCPVLVVSFNAVAMHTAITLKKLVYEDVTY